MTQKQGYMITCDRCGVTNFDPNSDKGSPQYSAGWRTRVPFLGYKDLCPKCYQEYKVLIQKWWQKQRSDGTENDN